MSCLVLPRSGPACFSPDRRYRYELHRELESGAGTIAFIGLNPSKADEVHNDPTVARCIGRACREGFRNFVMLNLFAYVSTDPRQLEREVDPIGPDNDEHILAVTATADLVVAAWGARGAYCGRGRHVRALLGSREIKALGFTHSGEPRHPLYLRGDSAMVRA